MPVAIVAPKHMGDLKLLAPKLHNELKSPIKCVIFTFNVNLSLMGRYVQHTKITAGGDVAGLTRIFAHRNPRSHPKLFRRDNVLH
jgi:hypothetical protein